MMQPRSHNRDSTKAMTSQSDKLDLSRLEAARGGDPEALRCVLIAYQPMIRRHARSHCATPSDAEDATQETLLQIYRNLGMLRAVEAFPSWAFSIVVRECGRMFRRMVGRDDPLPEPDADLAPLLVERIDQELTRDVAVALARIPEHYRVVLLMHDVERYTAPEIASELEMTVEAVKSRVHRGRRMLRELLAGWDPADH